MSELMPIEHVSDWEMRLKRQDAFWSREIIDRPVVFYTRPSPNPDFPAPTPKTHATFRDRWMDAEYLSDCALHGTMNTEYCGDALPSVWPNLGPEIFSAFYGCELEYTESTAWTVPCLEDWGEVDKLVFSEESFYWNKLLEMTEIMLEKGRGKYYVGATDLHPGADAITAFRDPLRLNLDMIECPDQVSALLKTVTRDFFRVFDFYYDKFTSAGQAITNWAGIVSTKKWYVLSNDFSCMISKPMFDEVFLPGIAEECRHFEVALYHLDGPGALQHLDSLLSIPELNAIQWVFGTGNGRPSDWMHIYKKCQAADKGLQLSLSVDELDFFIENLRPQGVWLSLGGVQSKEHGEELVKKISRWR